MTRLKVRSERELEFSKITTEASLEREGQPPFHGNESAEYFNPRPDMRPAIYSDEKWKGEEAWKKRKKKRKGENSGRSFGERTREKESLSLETAEFGGRAYRAATRSLRNNGVSEKISGRAAKWRDFSFVAFKVSLACISHAD